MTMKEGPRTQSCLGHLLLSFQKGASPLNPEKTHRKEMQTDLEDSSGITKLKLRKPSPRATSTCRPNNQSTGEIAHQGLLHRTCS